MAEKLCILRRRGGVKAEIDNNAMTKTYSIAQMRSCTDANPIVISDDFSKARTLVMYSQYNYEVGYTDVDTKAYDVELNNTIAYRLVTNATYGHVGGRNITVTPNNLRIGSGGYYYGGGDNFTTDSDYGLILILQIVFNK